MLLNADEWQALRLSLEVALWSLLWNLPVATAVAWLLVRRRFPGRTLLDAFVHLPLVLPPVLIGYLLLVLFGARGPIGGWLQRVFGIHLIFTTAGTVLAVAVMTFPLMVRAIRLTLEGIDVGLEEAARTLPLALYTALQTPNGDATAARLAITSFTLGLSGLVLSEWLSRTLRRQLGRGIA